MANECNCPIKTEPGNGEDTGICWDRSEADFACTKPEGHDGPHSACSVTEHPIEVWENDG